MKPLKVTMQAFGSYGSKETIDLTVPAQNLFLISGATGSGKTTIFDAIVFALYGEASSTGNKKDGAELQSQYAGKDVEPFVELEFSDGGLLYTVHRSPRHFRVGKRGGVTNVSASVSLTMPDGSVYPAKETDKKLAELVGLTKPQFMQVGMIAQGEFMELLRAKTDKKKEIFRKLFKTGIYQDIVDELAARCKAQNAEVQKLRADCRSRAELVHVPEWYVNAEETAALQKRICAGTDFSVADLEAFLPALCAMCSAIDAKRAEAQLANDAASEARDIARDAATAGTSLLKAFERHESAQKTLTACEQVKDEMDAQAQLAARIDAAWELKTVFDRYAEAAKAVADTEAELAALQEKLPALTAAYTDAKGAEAAAAETLSARNGELAARKERIDAQLKLFNDIVAASTAVKKANTELGTAQTRAGSAQAALDTLAKQEADWRETEARLQNVPVQLTQWETRSSAAGTARADLEALREAGTALDALRKKAAAALKEYEDLQEQYGAANRSYNETQAAFFNAQAGILAREKLRPGQPCPVCGSTEHPAPCVLAEEHKDLTQEYVDELKVAAEKLLRKLQKKAPDAGTAKTRVEEQEKHLAEGLATLRATLAAHLEAVPELLTTDTAELLIAGWQTALREEEAVLRAGSKQLDAVRASLAGVPEQRSTLKAAEDKATEALSTVKAALEKAKGLREDLTLRLEFDTAEEAEAVLSDAREAAQTAQASYNTAHSTLETAKTEKEAAETLIQKYTADLPAAREDRDSKQAGYLQAAAEKQLSEAEWQATVAAHRKQEAEVLRKQLAEFREKRAVAEKQAETALEDIGGREKPDMTALEEARDKAQQALNAAAAALEELRSTGEADRSAYTKLSDGAEKRNKAMADYNRMNGIYRRLSGNVTGGRMDVETYVQRYYLERILKLANHRFAKLSGGEFELRLCDIADAGEGKNRGLDLMVYSHVTNQVREVRTLSGGESFMAALSLALGMADQIQRSSSAVHLDFMFIDEGFGSLDDNSRSHAVRLLKEMAGSNRLIGIISHVSELKQEIDDQLLVTRDNDGSRTRWQS